MKTFVVVNPCSANGRTAGRWPGLAQRLGDALGPFETAFTRHPMDAAALAGDALRAGCRRLIVVGGDGTLNEALNGLLADGAGLDPDVHLGFLPQGTGGDFRRTLGLAVSPAEAIGAIWRGRTRRIDVGRATFVGNDGETAHRYFANVASFGMSGLISKLINEASWSKRLGGSVAFYLATVRGMIGYRNRHVGFTVDGRAEELLLTNTGAVCNGRYFGGGMNIAPMAEPDDGILDIVVLGDFGMWDLIKDMPRLYRGTHLELDEVTVLGGRRLRAASANEVRLEVDGEPVGRLPATFEAVPAALTVIA